MAHNWLGSALFLFVFSVALHGQGRDALIQSVNSLPGWTASGVAETFNESTIAKFDLKLAPDLHTYGISGVTVQSWHSPRGQVKATLFEFMDASAAYGFFTIRRKVEGPGSSEFSAGTESFQSGRLHNFWQSRYVVQLEGESDAINTVARTLSENILGRSQRPSISNHLPSMNLVQGSEEYILDAANVQNVDGVNPLALGFDVSAEAASADYRVNGQSLHLILVLYPTQQIAKKYADQINVLAPKLPASRKRIGPLLAIVSGTTDTSIIQSLMDQIHYESKVTWNEPQPGLGLGPVIITVFTFVGILLGGCIVVGISLGGIRILMKAFYPNRILDRPGGGEFIQLKLDQELIRKELGE